MRCSTASSQQDDRRDTKGAWACARGFWVVLHGWPGIFPGVFLFGTLVPVLFGETDPIRLLLVAAITGILGSVAVVSFLSRTHRVFGYKRIPRDVGWPGISLMLVVFSSFFIYLRQPPGDRSIGLLSILVILPVGQGIWVLFAVLSANRSALGRPDSLAKAIDEYKGRHRDVMRRRAETRAARPVPGCRGTTRSTASPVSLPMRVTVSTCPPDRFAGSSGGSPTGPLLWHSQLCRAHWISWVR